MSSPAFITPIPSALNPVLAHRSSTSPRRPKTLLAPSVMKPTVDTTSHVVATIAVPAPPSPTDESSAACSLQPGQVISVATPDQFDELTAQAKENGALIVADFMAKWCRKCKYLLPRMRKLADKHPDVYFCTVDVNAVARLPRQFNITKMPTFIFLREGAPIRTYIGGASPQEVANHLDSLVEKHAS